MQARLFAGVTDVKPENLNQELTAQGLREFKSISKFGAEITYPVARFLDVGMNYTKRYMSRDEIDSDPSTDYQALLDQDTISLVARVPVLKTGIVRLDAVAGIGGSNTTLTLKSASQDGELLRREGGDWLATLYSNYGASIAIGYKNFFLVVEGGVESNKVDSFKRKGTINENIHTIDLSGSYVTVGLLFDGISAHKK